MSKPTPEQVAAWKARQDLAVAEMTDACRRCESSEICEGCAAEGFRLGDVVVRGSFLGVVVGPKTVAVTHGLPSGPLDPPWIDNLYLWRHATAYPGEVYPAPTSGQTPARFRQVDANSWQFQQWAAAMRPTEDAP